MGLNKAGILEYLKGDRAKTIFRTNRKGKRTLVVNSHFSYNIGIAFELFPFTLGAERKYNVEGVGSVLSLPPLK